MSHHSSDVSPRPASRRLRPKKRLGARAVARMGAIGASAGRILRSGRGESSRSAPAQRQVIHSIIGRSGRLSYLFGRLCGKLPGVDYIRHLLVAMPTDRIPPAMPRGYVTRAIPPEELALHRIDASVRVQAERFAAGMTCIGVFDRQERLLGVTWLCTRWHDETVLRVRFRLPPGTAWDGGLWIDEERRVSRAFPALWAGVRLWLEAQGLHRTVSSIADYNAASIAAHRRLGAQVIGQVGILRIGPVQCTMGGGRLPRLSRRHWPEIGLEG